MKPNGNTIERQLHVRVGIKSAGAGLSIPETEVQATELDLNKREPYDQEYSRQESACFTAAVPGSLFFWMVGSLQSLLGLLDYWKSRLAGRVLALLSIPKGKRHH